VLFVWFTAVMSDNALIRLQNLHALGLGPTELVQQVGSTYPYWRDLLAGKKSFGEKIARRIEEALKLNRGYLDEAHATADVRLPMLAVDAQMTPTGIEGALAELDRALRATSAKDRAELQQIFALYLGDPVRYNALLANIKQILQ